MKKLTFILILLIPLIVFGQRTFENGIVVDDSLRLTGFARIVDSLVSEGLAKFEGNLLLSSGDTLNYIKVTATDTVISINGVEIPFGESFMGTIDHDQLTNFNAAEHFTQGAISIPASQISDFDTEVSNNTTVVINSNQLKDSLGWFNVKSYGAVGDGITDDTEEIQAACDAAYAATNGKVVAPSGDYLISSAITIRSDADFTGATFNITGTTDTAVIFLDAGSQVIKGKQVIFPRVVQGTAPTGGAWTGTSVGVAIVNSYNNTFYIPYIEDFVKGLLITSKGNTGSAHNIITFGDIIRCKIGLCLSPLDDNGYTNSNIITGGRITEYPGYDDIAGHHGVVLDSNNAALVNNNLLVRIALGGDSWENQIACYGAWNTFQDFRLEPSDGVNFPARVFYGKDISSSTYAYENLWLGGYQSDQIIFTRSSGATDFALMGASTFHVKGNPPLVIQPHVSINDPGIYIMRSDYDGPADPDSTEEEYGIRIAYKSIEGKQNTQTNPQWGITGYAGDHKWGPGNVVYDTRLYRSTTATLRLENNLIVDSLLTATHAIIQPLISHSLTDGTPTDAELDAATGSTPAGVGAGWKVLILDSDGSALIYMIISDGANWQYQVLTIAS